MNYPIESKNSIIEEYKNGKSVSELIREFQVPRSTIYNWIDINSEKPFEELFISKHKLKQLKEQLERTLHERTILIEILDSVEMSISQKLDYAKQLNQKGYSVHMICRVLNMNRSTFYHDKYRRPEVTLIEADDSTFKPSICKIFTKTNGRLGARKIRFLMMKEGHVLSERRVQRLMGEMNLIPNRPDEDYNQYHKRKYAYKPSIISKSELYPEPNKVWVSDITYIRVQNEHNYLFVIIDLFSRKVIGQVLSLSLEANVLVELMQTTYMNRHSPQGLIFHSDRGLQYTSKEFSNYLESIDVTQSFSQKANPYDNSVAESFFASLKKEEIYRHIYKSFTHLQNSIDEYVIFYNTIRPHGSLGNMTPDEFEKNGHMRAK
jgi:putative transposase